VSPYDHVLRIYGEIDALGSAISLLNWDRQVLMPPAGAAARTEHVRRLAARRHALWTSPEFARDVEELEHEGSEPAVVRVLKREIESQTKLPADLVDRKSRASSEAYEVWKLAKAQNRFSMLEPFLRELFSLAKETAECLGYQDHVYDPLIDLFEQGSSYAEATNVFQSIKGPIIDLLREIREKGVPVDDTALLADWDQPKLRNAAQAIAGRIGFDFGRGRLDIAPNAFCTHLAVGDVRMTTRPSEHIKGILSSSLHEMGHGLYEQGVASNLDRTPLAGGASLAVHESQSRLWENIVGRSAGFWKFFWPSLQSEFSSLKGLDAGGFYRAINKVEPSFIRVGADELSYNLHILLRFELEVEILTGRLETRDLPEAWNQRMTEYLGITPPTDTLGVLQDVHWSRGSVGYFPTYTMGNLIGAQIWSALQREIPDTEGLMAKGEFAPILGWLQDRLYRHGRELEPKELVRRTTGSEMRADEWLGYVRDKYSKIYAL
jgi:carboxypeptidase Taq